MQQVNFLSFVISVKGVTMDPSQVSTIADWPTPKIYQKVQIFLNFMNFYQHFIKNYSKIAESLTKLLKKSVNRKKQELLQ